MYFTFNPQWSPLKTPGSFICFDLFVYKINCTGFRKRFNFTLLTSVEFLASDTKFTFWIWTSKIPTQQIRVSLLLKNDSFCWRENLLPLIKPVFSRTRAMEMIDIPNQNDVQKRTSENFTSSENYILSVRQYWKKGNNSYRKGRLCLSCLHG